MNDTVTQQQVQLIASIYPQNNPQESAVTKQSQMALDNQDHAIDPVAARRAAEGEAENVRALEQQHLTALAAQATADQASKVEDIELKNQLGLSVDKLASIASGQPDADAPQNPSSISPVKEMSLAELTQVVYALKAQIDILNGRFNALASENFKVNY